MTVIAESVEMDRAGGAESETFRTVVLEWEETSRHRLAVNVPSDWTDDAGDLGDEVAEVSSDAFLYVERDGFTWTPTTFQPGAPSLNLEL